MNTTTDTKYNGWTNYATWRVNLEVFDCQDNNWDWFNLDQEAYELSKEIQEYVENYIEESTEQGLARDYALAFLSDVNWHEIAEHMLEAFAEQTQD